MPLYTELPRAGFLRNSGGSCQSTPGGRKHYHQHYDEGKDYNPYCGRDFGYRAVHETAVQGKATVAALYGSAPRFSYFNGCSGGGRQSFMEAQRYPQDFDAIIAGAPGYDRTHGAFQSLRAAQATHKTPASFIPATKYPAIHRAAVNACDEIDGLSPRDAAHCSGPS